MILERGIQYHELSNVAESREDDHKPNEASDQNAIEDHALWSGSMNPSPQVAHLGRQEVRDWISSPMGDLWLKGITLPKSSSEEACQKSMDSGLNTMCIEVMTENPTHITVMWSTYYEESSI